ncbi:MAG: hypothetical protein M5R36_03045 [Deltaproteobacteria bacterium]|nr:hypothetical protein [Deltaproteobacteria bacterium]
MHATNAGGSWSFDTAVDSIPSGGSVSLAAGVNAAGEVSIAYSEYAEIIEQESA